MDPLASPQQTRSADAAAPAQARSAPLYRHGAWGRLAEAVAPLVALSGVVLLFAYRPDPQSAWASVVALRAGDLGFVRDLHRWGGELLLVALWLHVFRVFVVGAYRRLPGWGLSIVCTILVALAAATGWALRFDLGAVHALTRLGLRAADGLLAVYVLHVFVLPLSILSAILLWRRGVDESGPIGDTDSAEEAEEDKGSDEPHATAPVLDGTEGETKDDQMDDDQEDAAS